MIKTVLGEIDKSISGNILIHEHIRCVSNDMLAAFGEKWLNSEKLENYAVKILKLLKETYNVVTFVDGTPIDLGRDAGLLKRVSEKSGVNIVASTGFYYYPSMLTCRRSAETLAEIFLYECENGLDGTDIKPGALKCAVDGILTKDAEKRLEALSIVQSKTGLPLYLHCSHNDDIAKNVMDIFERNNVNPSKTVFGHASRRVNADYLKTILNEGYYISIDQSWPGSEEKIAAEVYKLCEMGYAKQLLFSHDQLLYNDFAASSNNTGLDFPESAHLERFSFLYELLVSQFKSVGISKENCENFLKNNPGELLDYIKQK